MIEQRAAQDRILAHARLFFLSSGLFLQIRAGPQTTKMTGLRVLSSSYFCGTCTLFVAPNL